MTGLAQWLRRLRTLLWTAFSILVISAAILVGVGKLLLPYSDRYQPQLEQWLSREIGQDVGIESFSGEWRAFGPRLTLKSLRIRPPEGETSESVLISEAALDLKPLSLFLPGQTFYSFLVVGADLKLLRDVEGGLHLSGLGLNEGSGAAFDSLVGLGELRLENSRLDVLDENSGAHLHFTEINALVQLEERRIAVSLESSLENTASSETFADVSATFIARMHPKKGLQNASWHLAVADLSWAHMSEHLPLHPLIPRQGIMQAESWGEWSTGQPIRTQGSVSLGNVWLSDGQTDIMLDRFSSDYSTRLTPDSSRMAAWQVDLRDTQVEADDGRIEVPGLTLARDTEQDLGLWVGADYLLLDESLPLVRQALGLLAIDTSAILPSQAAGSVLGMDIVLGDDWSMRWLNAELRDVSIAEWQNQPELAGINGQVTVESGAGYLDLHSPALSVHWPRMFSREFQLRLPECRIEVELGQEWQVFLHGCQWFNEDLSAQGDVWIVGNENRPAVDINVEVLRLEGDRLDPYWPDGILPPPVSAWLRENLKSGHVDGGRLSIFGDMDHWPFSDGAGHFEAWAQFNEGQLSFAPGWPDLGGVDGIAWFIGPGMFINAVVDSFGGVPVADAYAEIETFGNPLLRVEFQGQGQVATVMEMLQQTPLLPKGEADLEEFTFGGSVSANGTLELPLGSHPGELQLNGKAQVNRGSFLADKYGVELEGVRGKVVFDEEKVRASDLEAVYKGKPARLGFGAGGDDTWAFEANLKGTFEVSEVLPTFLTGQANVFDQITGSTDWLARLEVPVRNNDVRPPVMLSVESGLQGVTMNLPAPLQKSDFEIWPLSLNFPLSGNIRIFDLNLDERFFVFAEIAGDVPEIQPAEIAAEDTAVNNASGLEPIRATVSLGQKLQDLPESGYLRLSGAARRIDLDGWVELVVEGARSGGGLGGLNMEPVTVQASELIFLDRLYTDVSVQLQVEDSQIRAQFVATDLSGQVVYTPSQTGSSSLNAEFERLVMGEPLSKGLDTQTDPAELPELHLYAQSFKYAGLEMGETRIEAYPTASGFHFEKVETNSVALSIQASGDWSLLEAGQRSDFDIMMTAESLGELLSTLDISSSLEGGQTVLEFNAWWPGSPAAFALERLNGEIDFSVTRGQITNANTGSGKVLGLLSIQSLPRRLALDFRDVFDSGFGFETASGTFRMENGTASTDDVKLTSSAASISLVGSTDLVNQQYDQQMTVMPGVGNTLPVIGAIAAGPGGAAAGLALQGLLHEQLGKATQVQYTITGSWDEPVVEPIVKRQNSGQPPEE